MIDKKVLTGVLAAVGASLCCITPVLAVLAGSTGLASSFSWMEPFRPYLIALTVLVLTYAWWDKLKPVKQGIECACDPDEEGKVSFWHTKAFLVIVTLFSAVMLSFPYWGETFIQSSKADYKIEQANLVRTVVDIEGMTCKACEATIEKVGKDVDGVGYIKASSEGKNAIVKFDKTKTNIREVMQAIATTGYKPFTYEKDGVKIKVDDIKVSSHQEETSSEDKENTNKCAGGKCASGKCGSK